MARKFVVKQPKNQRAMINDAYTASVKKKMGYAFVPFILGALILVMSMGQIVEDKTMRVIVLVVGVALFLIGILYIIKSAKDLNDYAKAYWEKEDAKNGAPKKQEEPREKITWAQAKAEYKEEAKQTAEEASRLMAAKFMTAEDAAKESQKQD